MLLSLDTINAAFVAEKIDSESLGRRLYWFVGCFISQSSLSYVSDVSNWRRVESQDLTDSPDREDLYTMLKGRQYWKWERLLFVQHIALCFSPAYR